MPVVDGAVVPANTRALLVAGIDGAGDARVVSIDTATGALEITGAISATNPSVGTNNAAIPASSTQVGGSDGTNLQAARVFDVDSGGGTQYVLGANLRRSAAGGSAEVLGQNTMALSLPVTVANDQTPNTGTLANGTQTAVGAAAVQIAAANANRKAILIQNLGVSAIRVGIAGVTATTGVRLAQYDVLIFEPPYVVTGAIFAIREGAPDSTALAQEIT